MWAYVPNNTNAMKFTEKENKNVVLTRSMIAGLLANQLTPESNRYR